MVINMSNTIPHRFNHFTDEARNQLPQVMNEAYITVPRFMVSSLERYFDRHIDGVPACLENSNIAWDDFALKYSPVDEQYPDFVVKLYAAGIPFYYQYEFCEDISQTIYFIPGKNNSNLTFVRPNLFYVKKAQWNRLIMGKINNKILDNYCNHLTARLNLIGDWTQLPGDWNKDL
ncbi:hypothetical protein Presley_32 [Acinetobacter phage Presley]|uniref:Uncharacterized protein n=1 Tax=Acinetobacter phage Presley TaxID=1406780 RepID=U5PW13_9CAUD|nr:hypothetical protein Presley_32 [Acinetobacter phage Presley]AGY48099.1 hypothetical protein Presley_32 [Acinetobacter phage Presley]